MRATRLVALLLRLQSGGGATASELARDMEVSVRTIYRDVSDLQAAGFPLWTESGPGGGIRLVEGWRTRLDGLSGDEAMALLLGSAPTAAGQLGLASAAVAARAKLLGTIPPELRGRVEAVAERFHLDAPGWFRQPDEVPLLATLAGAVWEGRRVAISYRRNTALVERDLAPLGLVLKGGVWYLVAQAVEPTLTATDTAPPAPAGTAEARDQPEGKDGGQAGKGKGKKKGKGKRSDEDPPPPSTVEAAADPATPAPTGGAGTAPMTTSPPRSYRVNRVERAVVGDEAVERPPEFDLAAWWDASVAEFDRSVLRAEVRVRLSPRAQRFLPHVTDPHAARRALDDASAPDDEGWVTVTLAVEAPEVAHDQLLALGIGLEVLDPPELRAALAATARALVVRHA